MLFDIPYIVDWNKIGVYRQCQTDLNTAQENLQCADYDYKVGDKVLIRKDVPTNYYFPLPLDDNHQSIDQLDVNRRLSID
jgi:hypothetical protein